MKNIKDNIMRTTILILLWVFVGPLSGFANNLSDEDKNKTDPQNYKIKDSQDNYNSIFENVKK